MEIGELPYVDEHATDIAAGVDDVWPVLIETLETAFSRAGMAGYARIVGCADWRASGPRPLAEGSTLPGFRIAAAVPGSELALEGRHHFSVYSWIFRLEQVSADRSRLRAETRAEFPGLPGSVYRLLVSPNGHSHTDSQAWDQLHGLWLAKKACELVCSAQLAQAAHDYTLTLHDLLRSGIPMEQSTTKRELRYA